MEGDGDGEDGLRRWRDGGVGWLCQSPSMRRLHYDQHRRVLTMNEIRNQAYDSRTSTRDNTSDLPK